MKRFGLHSAIWATASTHFVVDAYGNMFAPLLPLLIPQLNLSLKTVGVLAMCYQLASSVSQLGFGTLADRWRPRVLLMGGPMLSVVVLSLIGTSTVVPMLAAHSPDWRSRRRGVSSAGRGARARGVRRSQGTGDVDAHLRRLARFCAGAAGVRARRRRAGAVVGVAGGAAGPGGTHLHAAADAAGGDPAQARQPGLAPPAAVRQAARPALHHRRPANAHREQPRRCSCRCC